MVYCLICKDMALDRRYSIKVNDTNIEDGLHGFLCRHCYAKFVESHANRGFFKVAKLMAWAKHKRDSMRVL